jgi:hypothetical protein
MTNDSTMTTSRASLCALGEYLKRQCFFAPRVAQGHILQKQGRYRPSDQLLDGLLGLLCGAKTIAQSHVTMRVAPAVQRLDGGDRRPTPPGVLVLSHALWPDPTPAVCRAPVVGRC